MDEKASSPNNPKSSNQTIDSEETLLTFDDYADAAQSEYNRNTLSSSDSSNSAATDTAASASDVSDANVSDSNVSASNVSDSEMSASAVSAAESTDSVERVRHKVSKRQQRKERGKLKKRHPIVGCLLALVLIVGLAAGGFVWYLSRPIYIEAGDAPSLGLIESNKIIRTLCKIDDDVDSIDTNSLGENKLSSTLFGFIPFELTAVVRDTTPPEVVTCQLFVGVGSEISAEDFVVEYSDGTSLTFTLDGEFKCDDVGEGQLTLIATDEAGNSTTEPVFYTVMDALSGVECELGLDEVGVVDQLSSLLPGIVNLEIDSFDAASCGSYDVTADIVGDELGDSDVKLLFDFELADTLAPTADVLSFDLPLGSSLTPESAVVNLNDQSECTLNWETSPDFGRVGEQTALVVATDAHGNSSRFEVKLYIHDLPSELTTEAGQAPAQLTKLIGGELTPVGNSNYADFTLGSHTLRLRGEYSEFTVTLNVVDTTKPTLKLRDLETEKGVLPSPEDFVVSCSDNTEVSFTYDKTPSVDTVGTYDVTIVATDEGGNTAKSTAELKVVSDTTPPVISGVKNLSAYEGDTISYRSGVTAYDETDGTVIVYVNSKNVNTSVAGTYTVTYTAYDTSGNAATASAKVTIKPVTQSTLDSHADEILSVIITGSMTEREKAKAIYDWCCENLKYSTVTSYLMGYHYKAAYSGYKLHYGNCYTYYAVARSLLTRAGITNMMIQRDSTTNPHYWNLVQIDGNWYHFDTCPQPVPNNDGCFLLTDAEVAYYSTYKEAGYYSFAAGVYPATP